MVKWKKPGEKTALKSSATASAMSGHFNLYHVLTTFVVGRRCPQRAAGGLETIPCLSTNDGALRIAFPSLLLLVVKSRRHLRLRNCAHDAVLGDFTSAQLGDLAAIAQDDDPIAVPHGFFEVG